MNDIRLIDLARRVVHRAANHDGGVRAAYDAWRLIRAGDDGVPVAVDAVWEAWIHSPQERWWSALSRWRRPARPFTVVNSRLLTAGQLHDLSLTALDDPAIGSSAAGLVHAMTMTGHPIAGIARRRLLTPGDRTPVDEVCLAATMHPDVVAFLVRHGIQPVDEPAAAAFLVLSGQQRRYWEHDPDQVLLARAYRERPALRLQLRDALPQFGDLDPARVVMAARTGVTAEPSEITFVAEKLADRHDWEGLWRFARSLPAARASQALRQADTEWRPANLDEAELYLLLCATEAASLLNLVTALDSPRQFAMEGVADHGAFSADDTRLAVPVRHGSHVVLQITDLVEGKTTETYDLGADGLGPVSFEKRRPIVCQPWPDEQVPGPSAWWTGDHRTSAWWIHNRHSSTVWWLGGDRRAGRALPGWALDLKPVTADGLAHVALLARSRGESPVLMTVRRHGPPAIRPARIAGLRWPPFDPLSEPVLATDPGSGRIAVGEQWLVVAQLGSGNRLRGLARAARAPAGPYRSLCFDGSDHLLVSDRSGVQRLRIADGLPVVSSTAEVHGPLVRVPYRNAVAVADAREGVVYLDAETLERQNGPGTGVSGMRGYPTIWASPSGTHAVCHGGRVVHVVLAAAAALAERAHRPLDESRPDDAATLAAARRHPEISRRAGPLLNILELAATARRDHPR